MEDDDNDLVLEGFDPSEELAETTTTDTDKEENAELLDKQNPDGSETETDNEDKEVKSEDPGAETPAPVEKPRKSGSQKRFDTLTRQREDAKRELERERREFEEYKKKHPETTASDEKEPDEDDFDDYSDYLDAQDAYQANQSKAQTPSAESKPSQPEMSDMEKTNIALIQEKVKASESLPEDFQSVAYGNALDSELTSEMIDAVASQADPAKVLYALGNDIQQAHEISQMSRADQYGAIADLGKQLAAPKKPASVSKASQPISTVRGDKAETKTLDEMSYEEFEAARNKGARRARSDW